MREQQFTEAVRRCTPGVSARGLPGRGSWMWMGLGACGLLALALAAASPPGTAQQAWGASAAAGYGAAAVTAAWTRRLLLSAAVAAAGGMVVPFACLALLGRAQLEVAVVSRASERLLASGSPYLADPASVAEFHPYLPGMAGFGLPDALISGSVFSLVAGPRWLFAAVFLVATTAAIRAGMPGRAYAARRRATFLWLTACPVVALPLVIGGVDPPVVALMFLALALAGRGRAARAGLALGMAAALKWMAWPAIPVVLALSAARFGAGSALRCAVAASVPVSAAMLPVLLSRPEGLWRNTVLYPFGLSDIDSTATAPFPGHLLATHVTGGTAIAVGALVLSAVFTGASLITKPPRHVTAAADRLALGLVLAIALAPASRPGYLIYPVVLFAGFRLLTDRTRPQDPPDTEPKQPVHSAPHSAVHAH